MKRELTLMVDGVSVTVTAERNGDRIVVERDGEKHEIVVTGDQIVPPEGGRAPSTLPSGSQPAAVAPASATNAPKKTTAAAGEVHAPMVGVVREIHTRAGAVVASGELLITMEAMKMDIYVNAPVAGSVAAVLCAVGETAVEGSVLATISLLQDAAETES